MQVSRFLKLQITRSTLMMVVILILKLTNIGEPVTNIFVQTTYAASQTTYAGSATTLDFFSRIFRRNSTDVNIVNELKIENAQLKVLMAENEALKNVLSFSEKSFLKSILVRVISIKKDDTIEALIIDRGLEDGLKNGQAVLTPAGIVIGKILTADAKSSIVLLATDSKSRIGVTIQNSKETIGILEGNRGLNAIIRLIPRTDPITAGDTIVTSGIDEMVPRGLVVGSVAKVYAENQEPFQSATIASLAETSYPIFVQVITSQNRK